MRCSRNVEANKKLGTAAALAEIEKHFPGTAQRLDSIWTAYGRQALFLWAVPRLDSASREEIWNKVALAASESLGNTVAASAIGSGWLRLEAPTPSPAPTIEPDEDEDVEADDALPPPRVLKFRRMGDSIEATVRMTSYKRFVYEDEEQRELFTQDVGLTFETGQRRIAKVFGGPVHARRAIKTFVEWMTGASLPQRNPALSKHLAAFQFTEAHVRDLAARLNLDNVGMRGSDAKKVLGKVALEGKLAGERLQALDREDDRVKIQEEVPQDLRDYNWGYEHQEDGFQEEGVVTFVFDKRQSHISFRVRTSRPAMANVVDELYAQVRGTV